MSLVDEARRSQNVSWHHDMGFPTPQKHTERHQHKATTQHQQKLRTHESSNCKAMQRHSHATFILPIGMDEGNRSKASFFSNCSSVVDPPSFRQTGACQGRVLQSLRFVKPHMLTTFKARPPHFSSQLRFSKQPTAGGVLNFEATF